MKRYINTKLVLGENSLVEFLLESSFKKTAFVISRIVFDALNLQETLLDTVYKNKDYKIILEIEKETNVAEIDPAIQIIQAYQPDGIVAIGGGSVIDAAKLLWLFYELPDYSWQDAYKFYQLDAFSGKAQLIAAPTTAGTGSEMTSAAMFIDLENQKKMFLDNQLLPSVAILDYNLIKTLPNRPLMYAAIDALTHALEAGTSSTTDLVTQFLALQSIVSIFKYLPEAIQQDQEARAQLMVASMFAGVCINNGNVGLAHSINYPGETFNLPHGLITGLITPFALRFAPNHPFYESLLQQLGVQEITEAPLQLSKLIFELYEAIGLETSLDEFGINQEAYFKQIPHYVDRFFDQDSAYSTAIQKLNREQLTRLFEELYTGVNI